MGKRQMQNVRQVCIILQMRLQGGVQGGEAAAYKHYGGIWRSLGVSSVMSGPSGGFQA